MQLGASRPDSLTQSLQRGMSEVASLYKGVLSAATGAGIIIGAYFAFYSTSKRFLRERTDWKEGGCHKRAQSSAARAGRQSSAQWLALQCSCFQDNHTTRINQESNQWWYME